MRSNLGAACLISMLLSAMLLSAPAAGETITDAAQRTVVVPSDIGRVAPADIAAQVLLQALAPRKLVGLTAPFAPEHAIYVDEALTALPQIPILTRTDAPGDVALVASLHPALVVSYGSTDARSAAAAELIQRELKVPTLLFSGRLDAAAAVATRLGQALGDAGRGERVAAIVADALRAVAPCAGLPDAERVPVYLAGGDEGLDAASSGGPLDEAIRLAGGRNVVAARQGDEAGSIRRMTVAAVAALKPAVVIVGESTATHGALRDALPKETRFVLDSGEPYRVLLGPASINRVAGVLALAAILHPRLPAGDPEAAARIETALFPIPPGLSAPAPLQLR